MVLCDLLIRLALAGYYRPLWSREILDETARSVLRRRPDLGIELLQRRVDAMQRVFPDAMVTGYDERLAQLSALGKDAHVLAAAVQGGADLVVTHNVRDFPAALLGQYQIVADARPVSRGSLAAQPRRRREHRGRAICRHTHAALEAP